VEGIMPTETFTPEYISTEDAARLTGLSVAWLERSRWAGDGPPYVKLGKAVRYPLDELRLFMRERLRISTTDVPRVSRAAART
jgi:predicted DNA-binding transcriptional regulator AlpA